LFHRLLIFCTALAAHGINFINENDARCFLFGGGKQFTYLVANG
jgi:hypothetical protein